MMDKKKRYLVTGGTGFVGQAIVDRLLSEGIQDLVVMARNEGNLQSLAATRPTVRIVMADIADCCAVLRAARGVSGIFHTAAVKGVGLAEDYAQLCTQTNVIGSMNVLSAANGMDFCLGVSSDKAAKVSGVYGATKLLMEKMFANAAEHSLRTAYRTVRYCNIFGSTGSVIPLWKEQLKSGRVTITTREATRFFMTVDQAVDGIIYCLNNWPDATPYSPCMMKAASVGDLLAAVIRKYAKHAPDVVETGLKPGENLHEIMGDEDSSKARRYTIDELMEIV